MNIIKAINSVLMESTAEPATVETRPCVPRRTVDITTPLVKLLNVPNPSASPRQRFRFRVDFTSGLFEMGLAFSPLQQAHSKCLISKRVRSHSLDGTQNKVRCAINVVLWTPEGRRCMTGTASGEFTLWSGTTFSFESILQAHEFGIRAMRFSHNEYYLVSGDESGRIKYWKPNLELLNDAVAHREAVRGIGFAPSDLKFCTCSDDATLKLWDFRTCDVHSLLSGHGADVKCIDWHPVKGLIASGSKDAQIKLWTPKDAKCVSTLYGHKAGVNQIWWNRNGNWLLSCSRDQVCKVFDIRMGKELGTYRGHTREVMCCQWHPNHEELFVSGGSDGALIYWLTNHKSPQAKVTNAHDTTVWSVSWHPTGHLLASGSSDYVTKFWCRPRPGEMWRDRHFQEFGEGKDFQTSQQRTSDDQQPLAIPGIDDVGAVAVKKPPLQANPVRGHQLQMPSGVRSYDFHRQKRMRFDLNLSSETGSYGGAMRTMESETGSEFDEGVMGSSLMTRQQGPPHPGARTGRTGANQTWTASIRIPKTHPS